MYSRMMMVGCLEGVGTLQGLAAARAALAGHVCLTVLRFFRRPLGFFF